MADDAPDASPQTEPVNIETKEDAETRAARRELKQSSISDPAPDTAHSDTPSAANSTARPATPAENSTDTAEDDMRDQVTSPKKKRAHDQLEGETDTNDNDATSIASSDSAKDRALRLEPEKKRHRDDEPNETSKAKDDNGEANKSPSKKNPPQTSASAFASSTFGKLSSGTSPFAALGASKGSAFGSSGTSALTSFASTSAAPPVQPTTAPKLTFGSATGASPFASVSSGANGFGGSLGSSPFGSALGGIKPLGSFAAPGGDALKTSKASKPFGAPDSDAEQSEGDESGDEKDQSEEPERAQSPEKESDDKKKPKLHKIAVDDGETGETTITSVRAKMFFHDKEAGWKERGAGMLKINVPQACVEFDDAGTVIPGSFDASTLDGGDEADAQGHKVVRLLLRQDQTHRVILNSVVLPTMKFQEKASLKSVSILFTAFEGEPAKPVNITMRMTAANAKIFMNEISMIQKELLSST